MMKFLTLSAFVASAAAFAPAAQKSSSSALAESPYAKEIGAMVPVSVLGQLFFSRACDLTNLVLLDV